MLYCFLSGIFLFQYIFIRQLAIIFGFIQDFDLLLHFPSYLLKPYISFISYTNLKIVTHRPEEPIQPLHYMRNLANTIPIPWEYIVRSKGHFGNITNGKCLLSPDCVAIYLLIRIGIVKYVIQYIEINIFLSRILVYCF